MKILAVTLIALALAQSGQGVPIVVPRWVTGGRCVSEPSGVRVDVRSSTVVVACGDVGLLRCDLGAAEPMDVEIKNVCTAGRIVAQQGLLRIVEAEPAAPISVEWVDWSPGKEPLVLASRVLGDDGAVVVAPGESRFMRFTRAGNSPLTVPETDLPTLGAWHLPDAGSGGEVTVTVAQEPVRPTALVFETGASVAVGKFAVDPKGRLRVPGVPPGKIMWRPVYEGGVIGSRGAAEVSAGRSTSIVIPRQDVGQLRVTLDADLCADAGETRIVGVRTTGGGAKIENERARVGASATCAHVFGGLPPGAYEVRVAAGTGGPVGAAVMRAVVVESQREALVEVVAPSVTVSGTVLLNGRPYPRSDLTVRFQRQGGTSESAVSANVLAGGGYSVRLPEPGRYGASLSVRELPFVGATRDLDVNAGQNVSDWSIEGGTLKVRVEQWDHSTPVQLTFMPVGADKVDSGKRDTSRANIGSAPFILMPDDDEAFELPGLALGSYTVQARQTRKDGSVRVSRTERAEVRETGSPGQVILTLADYGAEIRLVDSAGQPVVTRAELWSLQEGPLTQASPGVFRATARQLSVGDPISVLAAGYLATCIIAPASGGATTVTLQPGARTVVEIRSGGRYGTIPGWVTVPGAACPIASGLLSREALPIESVPSGDVISRFAVTQLPMGGAVLFQNSLTDAPTPLARNADGVLVIRR